MNTKYVFKKAKLKELFKWKLIEFCVLVALGTVVALKEKYAKTKH